jgi:choline dehydrogenase-like flavoprotein
MLHDARAVPSGTLVDTDVCIVGGGPAGITLARELIAQPFRVCLLEGAGLRPDAGTTALLAGKNIGDPYQPLDRVRSSVLGGTTDRWTGTCRPLEEMDFETRSWVPHSGWPFGLDHLRPYYERAHSVCQLGPYAYDAGDWQEGATRPALPLPASRVATAIFQFSPPTRFGRAYRAELTRAPNVATYLHGNAMELETEATGATVTRLRVASLGGASFAVASRLFILAAGGIENARLLLLSSTVHPPGLGNRHDLVGRFFMEHPHPDCGDFIPSRPLSTSLYATHTVRGTRIRGALTVAPDVLRRESLLGSSLLLQRRVPRAVTLLRRVFGAVRSRVVSEHDWHRVLDAWTAGLARWQSGAGSSSLASRRVSAEPLRLLSRAEQAPNPESRVTLGPERDALGRRRARLDWRLSPIDRWSVRHTLELIGQEIADAGIGRFELALTADASSWPVPVRGGAHHMGTTRMHDDPRHGVVDRHCRVHGVSNLYVAGSSTFPSVGYANPTLTIVALAIRLSDHVKLLLR